MIKEILIKPATGWIVATVLLIVLAFVVFQPETQPDTSGIKVLKEQQDELSRQREMVRSELITNDSLLFEIEVRDSMLKKAQQNKELFIKQTEKEYETVNLIAYYSDSSIQRYFSDSLSSN